MKKIIPFALVLVLAGIGIGWYMYNKPHQNMERAQADYALEASHLFQAFELDETAANTKYLDKIVEVKGKIKDIKEEENGQWSITLDTEDELFGVICQMDPEMAASKATFQEGQEVRLKGVCTGILMDVILVRCVALS